MQPGYECLIPQRAPPTLRSGPFLAILIADEKVSGPWRNEVADWLVTSNCLFFVTWGVDCELWHDSVDEALLEAHDYGDIPDERHVMTTWHDKEPLADALWFAGKCASHPYVELTHSTILHVASRPARARVLEAFRSAQEMTDE